MTKKCNPELLFKCNGADYILTNHYKDRAPLLFWYNVGLLSGGMVNFDVRQLGLTDEQWIGQAIGIKRVARLQLVRDLLKSNRGEKLHALIGSSQGVTA